MMNDRKDWKKAAATWVLLAAAIGFMFCIFAPLDAYYANSGEYWFGIRDLLPVVLAAFAIALVALSVVFLLLGRLKWSPIVCAFIIVLTLFFYIQGNYIPRNYGVLDGTNIDWNAHAGLGAASIALAAVCLVLFLLMIVKFRDKVFVIGKYVAVFLLVIQVITLGVSFVQKELLSKDKNGAQIVVTDKNLFSLSKDGQNIVVFLLDAFDGAAFDDLLQEKPELCKETLENFTWYRDTLGIYPTTKGALPNILTGEWYENEIPYAEHIANAYETSTIYPTLLENDYTLDIYTNDGFLNRKPGFYSNVFPSAYRITNPTGFAENLYRLVLFNYMPHQLKQGFIVDTASFDQYRDAATEDKVYSKDTYEYYNRLLEEGFTAEQRGNVFKFCHLVGLHPPFNFGENLQRVKGEEYTIHTAAAGNMTLLKEVFAQMKALGLYDDSEIIIMADHGQYDYHQNPILMVKNRNESHDFSISDAEMTYEYLPAVFTALARGETVDPEFVNSQQSAYDKRRFLYYTWDDCRDRAFLPGMDEMFCDGYAYDPENLVASGKTYLSDSSDAVYTVGDVLSFLNSERTAQPYCLYGFAIPDLEGTWTMGKDSVMRMKIKGDYDNLRLSMDIDDFYIKSQLVSVYANEKDVGSFIVNGDKTYNLVIPHDYVEDNTLELRLHVEAPLTLLAEEAEPDDKKARSLHMRSLTLMSTEDKFDLDVHQPSLEEAFRYEPGTPLSFAEDTPTAKAYILSGISYCRGKGAWTDGNRAEMLFIVGKETGDLQLEMSYGVFNLPQRVTVSINGQIMEAYEARKRETKTIAIPSDLIKDGEIRLSLDLPDACTPKSVGFNEDTRMIALVFYDVVIKHSTNTEE